MKAHHLLAVGLLAVAVSDPRLANAAPVVVNSPYGDSVPVMITLGYTGGQNWVVYQRMSDAHCTWFLLSTGPTLSSNVIVNLSEQADFALVPGAGQTFDVWCPNLGAGWTVGQEQQVGDTFVTRIEARGGNDFMLCSGSGYVYCNGWGGDDFMKSWNDLAFLDGDAGNDTLIAVNAKPWTFLSGGNGDDCISATPPEPVNYLCGASFYDRSTGIKGSGCESVVASCQ